MPKKRESTEKSGKAAHGTSNFRPLTPEERRKLASIGGRACVEAKRKRKALREIISEALSLGVPEERVDAIAKELQIHCETMTADQAIVCAQVIQAMRGDTAAASWLRDTAGEKPGERIGFDPEAPFVVDIKVVE